ncbi:MAG: glutamine-hydrolyzing GMP synthase [Ardenticatenales bacterium]|nr:glutamine-hydrolyzing GMP synthase [Ardenticatenales bacterium]
MKPQTIAILDFGSQYTQLIARRVREAQVYCELLPWNVSTDRLAALDPSGIILSGGPSSVYEANAPTLNPWVLSSGRPVLGICYGMQLLAHNLGGHVAPAQHREYGPASLTHVEGEAPLFKGLSAPLNVWMSHGDRLEAIPTGWRILASTASSPYAAMGDVARHQYGIQFHPEVHHTPQGDTLIENFLFEVCGCSASWTPANVIDEAIARIREQVGSERVLCGLSGGVDSTVAATLMARAIGDQLTCVFVDHGMLRQHEAEEVLQSFDHHLPVEVVAVNARERFLQALSGVTDPEQKRRIIGREFVEVFKERARSLGHFEWLGQGTLYPDVIESAGQGTVAHGSAATIKTHHNVGGLPKELGFKGLVEPLRFLFKDEVRRVGLVLGLPESMIHRQPFPGPGLAVRILGDITEDRLITLQAADAIVREEIEAAGLGRPDAVWQYFAILTQMRSVGVMGDGRTYGNVVAVRAVASTDGMTADWARLPHDLLGRLSSRIVNEVPGVNRVVYDITSKPPGTIEWE